MAFNFSDSVPAAPAGTINVKWQVDGSGDISAYVPSAPILASADLTGQTAAIAATTLFTPSATGFYRISAYLKVTTPDGVASILGGASGLTITYTDGTDSVAQSVVAQLANQAGTAAIVNAGNTTTSVLQGTVNIYALTAVAVQYAVGYTSTTPGAMAFEVRLRAEKL